MRSGSLAHWPTITAEWADFSDSWLRSFDIVPPEKEKSRSADCENDGGSGVGGCELTAFLRVLEAAEAIRVLSCSSPQVQVK
jgi:hypothetical protein